MQSFGEGYRKFKSGKQFAFHSAEPPWRNRGVDGSTISELVTKLTWTIDRCDKSFWHKINHRPIQISVISPFAASYFYSMMEVANKINAEIRRQC